MKALPPEHATNGCLFMGLTNFYQRFIIQFTTMAIPLYLLTQKAAPLKRNEECAMIFQHMIEEIASKPILRSPN